MEYIVRTDYQHAAESALLGPLAFLTARFLILNYDPGEGFPFSNWMMFLFSFAFFLAGCSSCRELRLGPQICSITGPFGKTQVFRTEELTYIKQKKEVLFGRPYVMIAFGHKPPKWIPFKNLYCSFLFPYHCYLAYLTGPRSGTETANNSRYPALWPNENAIEQSQFEEWLKAACAGKFYHEGSDGGSA